MPIELISAEAPVMVEFRCCGCWHSNFAACNATGEVVGCRNCGNEITVPEATPDRVARAQAMLQDEIQAATPLPRMHLDKSLSDKEITALAQKEMFVPLDKMDFTGYGDASLWSRFFAHIVDGILFLISIVAGGMLAAWMTKRGLPVAGQMTWRDLSILPVALSFSTMLILSQWVLLATDGQTIGKKLFMIRIVSMRGQLPGFLRAVVLRNWFRNLLSIIPFFALIDHIFGLGNSRRCIHDLLAGTRVVQVS